jgi:hypothetical protein
MVKATCQGGSAGGVCVCVCVCVGGGGVRRRCGLRWRARAGALAVAGARAAAQARAPFPPPDPAPAPGPHLAEHAARAAGQLAAVRDPCDKAAEHEELERRARSCGRGARVEGRQRRQHAAQRRRGHAARPLPRPRRRGAAGRRGPCRRRAARRRGRRARSARRARRAARRLAALRPSDRPLQSRGSTSHQSAAGRGQRGHVRGRAGMFTPLLGGGKGRRGRFDGVGATTGRHGGDWRPAAAGARSSARRAAGNGVRPAGRPCDEPRPCMYTPRPPRTAAPRRAVTSRRRHCSPHAPAATVGSVRARAAQHPSPPHARRRRLGRVWLAVHTPHTTPVVAAPINLFSLRSGVLCVFLPFYKRLCKQRQPVGNTRGPGRTRSAAGHITPSTQPRQEPAARRLPSAHGGARERRAARRTRPAPPCAPVRRTAPRAAAGWRQPALPQARVGPAAWPPGRVVWAAGGA